MMELWLAPIDNVFIRRRMRKMKMMIGSNADSQENTGGLACQV